MIGDLPWQVKAVRTRKTGDGARFPAVKTTRGTPGASGGGDIISRLMARVPKLLDVSVPLVAGMPAYPGNPEFELQPVKRIAEGASSNVSRLVMGTHTGTHVDAPRHFFDDGGGVDALPLDLLLGRARVVEIPKRGGIGAEELAAAGLREDLRVLLKTPNSALWNDPGFHPDYTHLDRRGRALPRRPGRQGRRRRLPVGRAVQEGRRAGAPCAARQRRRRSSKG